MKNVLLIGAGNIGSRHLQALKKVIFPLSIEVVDPSEESLKIAEERYNQIQSDINHQIKFIKDLSLISKNTDLAIIATSSNIRREVTEKLLNKCRVKYIIFEKLLFQKKEDFVVIEKLLSEKNIQAWVNCSMRVTPFYFNLKKEVKDQKINLVVNGSRYGFITNLIHFIDYIAYLSDCYDFTLETAMLDKNPIESKRKGFLEMNGILTAYFKNGSTGTFICYEDGEAPVVIEILNKDIRAIANETNRQTFISKPPQWNIEETKDTLPFQSDLTNVVVQDLFEKENCKLAPYSHSLKLHLIILEKLKDFLNINSSNHYDYYPFT